MRGHRRHTDDEPDEETQLSTLPKTPVCTNCGTSIPNNAQFCPTCGARAADIQPSLQELFHKISDEMNAKLELESERFSKELEQVVVKKVEEITAPLTQDALHATVAEIAKGFIEQYSVSVWRVRQIAQEEVAKLSPEIERLHRRIGAIEARNMGKAQ